MNEQENGPYRLLSVRLLASALEQACTGNTQAQQWLQSPESGLWWQMLDVPPAYAQRMLGGDDVWARLRPEQFQRVLVGDLYDQAALRTQ